MGTLDESESGKTVNPKTMRGPFCESADVLILPMMMGNLQTELFVT